ncbi:PREDICTED: eukaryotic translation initiation factor 4E-binding protein 3-like isoform X2 [Trachymyrmex cornetzi]|uniref:eukaryotic translation initiation factor 4E-binding protein 3-like isoform X2 n=1 Tax=Trachymyrmex cornetzi TaxID=471704 RepID=UPI00084EF7E8|nr:PREDICTED: eukaryotic translation initiation factor 4E-binding protein 3-like isoform X2 [Trachymyrmex cornetzi]
MTVNRQPLRRWTRVLIEPLRNCDEFLLYYYYYYSGTRIVYERAFLMNLRNSPISRTPPRNPLTIPSELLKGNTPVIMKDPAKNTNKDSLVIEESAEQFEMDM